MANYYEIINSIDNYIESHIYHYALMINGKWGCGKTFFITEKLIPHLEQQGKKVNYISLYGIDNVDEIGRRLCIQSIKEKMGKKGSPSDSKLTQITTVIMSAVAKAGLGRINIDDSSIDDLALILPNYDNNVIVFDDLERCNCDINEVLGYINNFVEHSDASVIIAANEEEIGNCQFERNPELQMLVALNTVLNIPVAPNAEENIEKLFHKPENNNDKDTFSIAELEQRKKLLFYSNEKYKRMKEKVVGHTIEFELDMEDIFNSIVEDKLNKLPILHDKLISINKKLVRVAESEKHFNLRTFQFFIEKSITLFKVLDNNYPELHERILLYTYKSAIRHMKGLSCPEWDGEYGDNSLYNAQNMSNLQLGFKFIDDLVYKDTACSEYINRVLKKYEELIEKEGKLEGDPYQLINEWYLHSDEELEGWLDQMACNIKKGMYSTALFTSIIKKISQLHSYGIMTDKCEIIFEAMIEFVEKADPKDIEELECEHFLPEGDEAIKKYKEMKENIEIIIDEKIKDSEKQLYEVAIENISDWGTNLLALSNESVINKKHTAIYWIEPDRILQRISSSSNYELQQFRYALNNYYTGHVYYENKSDDINNLKLLLELIKKEDTSSMGQIKKNYYLWIVNDINRYIEMI